MSSLNQLIDELTLRNLSQHISVEDLFSKKTTVSPVEGVHIGLYSTENLISPDVSSNIQGIWLQQIDPSLGKSGGRIMPHDHGAENIDEIVITEQNSVYAGIPSTGEEVETYTVFYIPAGTVHGSATQPSYGRWVSIKFRQV